jgi:hypothetical protein
MIISTHTNNIHYAIFPKSIQNYYLNGPPNAKKKK